MNAPITGRPARWTNPPIIDAAFVAARRLELGMSREALAAAVGVAQLSVATFEGGGAQSHLTLGFVADLAAALAVDVADLIAADAGDEHGDAEAEAEAEVVAVKPTPEDQANAKHKAKVMAVEPKAKAKVMAVEPKAKHKAKVMATTTTATAEADADADADDADDEAEAEAEADMMTTTDVAEVGRLVAIVGPVHVDALAEALGWTLARVLVGLDGLDSHVAGAGQRVHWSGPNVVALVPVAGDRAGLETATRRAFSTSGLMTSEAQVLFELIGRPAGVRATTLPAMPFNRLRAAGLAEVDGESETRTAGIANLSDEGRFALCVREGSFRGRAAGPP